MAESWEREIRRFSRLGREAAATTATAIMCGGVGEVCAAVVFVVDGTIPTAIPTDAHRSSRTRTGEGDDVGAAGALRCRFRVGVPRAWTGAHLRSTEVRYTQDEEKR